MWEKKLPRETESIEGEEGSLTVSIQGNLGIYVGTNAFIFSALSAIRGSAATPTAIRCSLSNLFGDGPIAADAC
jgi:hypothetical protein